MVLNVSGRTDVVAFYTEWFMNRYKEGFVDVRNPFNPKLISRIYFSDVDAIVFCTKNPIPILKYIDKIKQPILFHITLTPYEKDIEPNVLPKGTIIESIKKLSKLIDKDNIYIRYDPIFISDKYNLDYHIKLFNSLCSKLNGYVNHIVISFMDNYKNVRKNDYIIKSKPITDLDYEIIGKNFSKIVKHYNMTVQTCSEEKNLIEYGFQKKDCISHELAFKLTGKTNFKTWKARNNKNCKCIEMVDIGVYNTCKHYCKYCYANYDEKNIEKNTKLHDKNSSLLIGNLESDDIIKIRK